MIHKPLAVIAILLLPLPAASAATGFGNDAPYTVAYASFGPINTAIYIADADGGHERLLIEGANFDMNPSFSPDGR